MAHNSDAASSTPNCPPLQSSSLGLQNHDTALKASPNIEDAAVEFAWGARLKGVPHYSTFLVVSELLV